MKDFISELIFFTNLFFEFQSLEIFEFQFLSFLMRGNFLEDQCDEFIILPILLMAIVDLKMVFWKFSQMKTTFCPEITKLNILVAEILFFADSFHQFL